MNYSLFIEENICKMKHIITFRDYSAIVIMNSFICLKRERIYLF